MSTEGNFQLQDLESTADFVAAAYGNDVDGAPSAKSAGGAASGAVDLRVGQARGGGAARRRGSPRRAASPSGAAYIHLMSGRVATLVELLLSRRTELRAPGINALRARGRIVAHEITVRDRSNRRYRMRGPSGADARAMLAGMGG